MLLCTERTCCGAFNTDRSNGFDRLGERGGLTRGEAKRGCGPLGAHEGVVFRGSMLGRHSRYRVTKRARQPDRAGPSSADDPSRPKLAGKASGLVQDRHRFKREPSQASRGFEQSGQVKVARESLINLRIMAHCAFDSRATVWTGS